MGYKVGDMVVYPRHGAAKVEAITERTVKGVTREYLQLSVLSSDGLVINVPVENAKKVGVRDIVGAKEVAKVFEILRTPIIEKEMNWSRRYKLNVEKIGHFGARRGGEQEVQEEVREFPCVSVRDLTPIDSRPMMQASRYGLPVCVGMVTASKVIRTVMSQPMR